jgi:transcriptional regulator with XRE-family HTH domain
MVISLHHYRYEKLRSLLKEIRRNSGLTQIELAKRLFMEQSNLSKIERGERYIDALLLVDYCRACNANAADVISKLDTFDDY